MHRRSCAGSDANCPAPDRHPDACAHTAADRYSNAGSAHGHKHAVADGDGHSRATHIYAHSNPADGNEYSQAQPFATQTYSNLGASDKTAHRASG